MPTNSPMLPRLLVPVHDKLIIYVVAAAATGLLMPDAAGRLAVGVPYMLAGQVLGVALTLSFGQFVAIARRPWPVLLALAAQWTMLPLVGVLLFHLTTDSDLRTGALIVAVAPAEITSALVAILAAGSGAVAIACMAGSLTLGTVLTPLWVSTVLGPAAHVDRLALIVELTLSVGVPLVVGLAIRTSLPKLDRFRPRALDLSAVCVVLVVFVSVGSARALVLSSSLLPAMALCSALLVMGYALGFAVAWPWRHHAHVWRALVFPVGMREFGIAAAVALAVSPGAVGVAGIYGALLMITAPAVARRLRPRYAGGGTGRDRLQHASHRGDQSM
jgi:BASS family bile acid:Na+ symporter